MRIFAFRSRVKSKKVFGFSFISVNTPTKSYGRGKVQFIVRILCIKNLYIMSEGSTIALEFSFVNLRSHNRNVTALAFWIRKFLPQYASKPTAVKSAVKSITIVSS